MNCDNLRSMRESFTACMYLLGLSACDEAENYFGGITAVRGISATRATSAIPWVPWLEDPILCSLVDPPNPPLKGARWYKTRYYAAWHNTRQSILCAIESGEIVKTFCILYCERMKHPTEVKTRDLVMLPHQKHTSVSVLHLVYTVCHVYVF